MESKIMNNSRKRSEDIGIPTIIKSKNNKIIPPLISKMLNRMNENKKSLNDEIVLSKSAITNYNYINNSRKIKNGKK